LGLEAQGVVIVLVSKSTREEQGVDGRDKPGHDEGGCRAEGAAVMAGYVALVHKDKWASTG
jgi:hypothetical protein